jgi:hypothetical protein
MYVNPMSLFAAESTSVRFEGGVVLKTTSYLEYEGLNQIGELLRSRGVSVYGRPVRVPRCLGFSDCELALERIRGLDFERSLLLADSLKRKRAADTFIELLNCLIQSQIGWLDLAPRNAIMTSDGEIILVDFERGVCDASEHQPWSWLVGHPMEETVAMIPSLYATFAKTLARIPLDTSESASHLRAGEALRQSNRRSYFAHSEEAKLPEFQRLLHADALILDASRALPTESVVYYPTVILDGVQHHIGMASYWTLVNALAGAPESERVQLCAEYAERLEYDVSRWRSVFTSVLPGSQADRSSERG